MASSSEADEYSDCDPPSDNWVASGFLPPAPVAALGAASLAGGLVTQGVAAEARRAGEAAVYCCPTVCWLRPGRSLEESELMLGSVSVLTWLRGGEERSWVRKRIERWTVKMGRGVESSGVGVPLWRGDGGVPDTAAEVVASSVEPQVVLVAPCWPPATRSMGVKAVQARVHDHLRQI